ncbi:MAG: peptidase S51 [Nocardioides sp.]|nr:peptidase S51 [Nocardioides sp.]
MKLLLTSAGIGNAALRETLDDLLGKPVEEATALVVPTSLHALGRHENAWRDIAGVDTAPLVGIGWTSVGVLELAALPLLDRERWEPAVRTADALLVCGGDPLFLHHWMRESGLAEIVPTLDDTVYVGLSAGSMVLTPRIGDDFVGWCPPGTDADTPDIDRTLGIVDFSLFPHLGNPMLPDNNLATAQQWAAGLGNPSYAIADGRAIRWVDGDVAVVGEGEVHEFPA